MTNLQQTIVIGATTNYIKSKGKWEYMKRKTRTEEKKAIFLLTS
jgi:hypothetical protein